jgi:PAS domain S-box-containing protein
MPHRQGHSRPNILIAADPATRLYAAIDSQAETHGFAVMGVGSAEDIQRLAAGQPQPDLILLDAALGMDCLDVCRRLKSENATQAIPVMLSIAHGDTDGKLAAFAAGAVDCISDEMQSEELIARIKTHLASRLAQKQLSQRNELLYTVLSSIGQGICFFDADRKLIFSNDRYAEVYGVDPKAIHPGQSLEDILYLRDQVNACPAMTPAEYLAWAQTTNVNDVPLIWVKELKSGKVIRGYHQRTEEGGWVSTHEDITKAWQAEKALEEAHAQAERAEQEARAAHARLLDAFEVVPEGLALFDAEDRYVLWNRRYEQLYAESGDKIVKGMRFEERLRAGLERGQYVEAVGREEEWLAERLARHAQPTSTHEQRLPGDRWVRIEERRISDGGSVGIRVDITDLKMREASFRLLFEGNPVPMWVYDRETLQFLDVNGAAQKHYGYNRQQFLGMTVLDIRPPSEWEALKTAIASTETATDGLLKKSWRHIKADGCEIDVMVYSSRLAYEGRNAALIAVVDVTERKRAEQALLQHRDTLEETVRCRTAEIARQAEELERMLEQERQINELQRQFVSMASHEFRTPLAVIDGAAQRLVRRKEGVTAEFIAEKADQIRSSVSRMLELMESILAVGRLDHGRISIAHQPCSLTDIIKTCSTRQESIRSTHRFLLDIDRLPPTISADRTALEQVFGNLFSNAVKYSPNAPNVHVTGWQDGDNAYITVRDEGIGIDADDLPRMFQRYFRARTSTGIAGTGIGLNFVKQIVELHDGVVEVASSKGNGTTFSLRIPIASDKNSEGQTRIAMAV